MIPRAIDGFNITFGPPKDWDEARQGPCLSIQAKIYNDEAVGVRVQTAWEPTPEELQHLINGGSVILDVVGGMVPVWLHVAPPAVEEPDNAAPDA